MSYYSFFAKKNFLSQYHSFCVNYHSVYDIIEKVNISFLYKYLNIKSKTKLKYHLLDCYSISRVNSVYMLSKHIYVNSLDTNAFDMYCRIFLFNARVLKKWPRIVSHASSFPHIFIFATRSFENVIKMKNVSSSRFLRHMLIEFFNIYCLLMELICCKKRDKPFHDTTLV